MQYSRQNIKFGSIFTATAAEKTSGLSNLLQPAHKMLIEWYISGQMDIGNNKASSSNGHKRSRLKRENKDIILAYHEPIPKSQWKEESFFS